jgi:hypothetical protein
VVAILAAIFFCQALFASLEKSPAWDEPYHISTALLYVQSGRIFMRSDHTPLLREIAGIFLQWAGIKVSPSPEVSTVLSGRSHGLEYTIGNAIIAENGADKVLLWARLPFVLMGTLLLFVIYWAGKAMLNEGSALCAAFLYTFDPLMISNSGLIYTDVGLALFTMVTVLALWAYLKRPNWIRIVCCGLALGATLASKYSGLVVLPAMGMLLLAGAIWPLEVNPGPMQFRVIRTRLIRYTLGFAGMCLVALSFLQYVYYFPPDPLEYFRAMGLVNSYLTPDYPYYMAGHYAKHFNSYLLVAAMVKEPLASIVLTIIGTVTLARSRSVSRLSQAFLLVPAGALFVAYSVMSKNLGVRYLAPVMPFALLAAGAGLATLLGSAVKWKKGAGLVLCAWLVIAAIGIYPDHMSYFNEAACLLDSPGKIGIDGGSRCGPAWLDDSNVDSGQGLKQLKRWLDQNASGRPVHFGYFGSTPPAIYGIALGTNDYPEVLAGTQPGIYVVSAHIVAHAHPGAGGNGADWLLRAAPIAVVGHSFYIYEKR